MPVPRQNMMFPSPTLRNSFSGWRVSRAVAAPAASRSECNDSLPSPSASRLDTMISHNGPRLVPNTPEDHLAVATNLDDKISPSSIANKVSNAATCEGMKKVGPATSPSEEVKSHNTEELRRNMREELLKRLSKSNLGGNQQTQEMQIAFSTRLEEILFKTSKSLEVYADTTTLDKRLQALMAAMQKRKTDTTATDAGRSRRLSQSTACKRSRVDQRKREVLLRVLGQEKMNRVFKVLAEIKLIQLGRKVTAGKPYNPIPVCTQNGCSMMVPCQGDESVPQPVRNLFFKTTIVTAYEKSSPEQFSGIPWDQLLAQGEARLAAYHEWFERQSFAISSHGR